MIAQCSHRSIPTNYRRLLGTLFWINFHWSGLISWYAVEDDDDSMEEWVYLASSGATSPVAYFRSVCLALSMLALSITVICFLQRLFIQSHGDNRKRRRVLWSYQGGYTWILIAGFFAISESSILVLTQDNNRLDQLAALTLIVSQILRLNSIQSCYLVFRLLQIWFLFFFFCFSLFVCLIVCL